MHFAANTSKFRPQPQGQNSFLFLKLGKLIFIFTSLPSREHEIMHDIFHNGPVEGAFIVYEDFPTYKSGVYSHHTGEALGGHAIRILGWGEENGEKYWLAGNSWNTDWGDKVKKMCFMKIKYQLFICKIIFQGFFKIKRGVDECGIEGEMVAGIPMEEAKFLNL